MMLYYNYKNNILFIILLFSSFIFNINSHADNIKINNPPNTAFHDFLKNIRCVTCQNQTLAESNAPVAETMRAEIYQLWIQGKSTEEIREILSSRYGEFVLYEPRVSFKTAILWAGPVIFLLLGLIMFRRVYSHV